MYRMTRAMFGPGSSPFLLGGTLNVRLETYVQQYLERVEKLSEGSYVDEINIGRDTVEETQILKEQAKEILAEGNFKIHKWHSNAGELETVVVEDGECTNAKETLGTKLLGLGWIKKKDTLSVALYRSRK